MQRLVLVLPLMLVVSCQRTESPDALKARAESISSVGQMIPNPAITDPTVRFFGWSAAIDDGLVAVGMTDPSRNQPWPGTAFVHEATTGTVLHRIDNPTPANADRFGQAVALDDGILVVGADLDDSSGFTNAGSAYAFDVHSGDLLFSIPNPAPSVDDWFGGALAIDGNTIAAGALFDDPSGVVNAGSVFLFDASNGALLNTIPNPAPSGVDHFGCSVALGGGLLAVGAMGASEVYIYNASTGALLQTIPAPGPGSSFGHAVAIDDGLVAVSDASAVHLFNATTGTFVRTFSGFPFVVSTVELNRYLDLENGLLAIGASLADPAGVLNAGSLFIYTTGGTLVRTVVSPEPEGGASSAGGDQLGSAVAIQGNLVVGGAWRDDLVGFGAIGLDGGSLRVFSVLQEPPVALSAAASTSEDTAVGVIVRAFDPNGDALTYSFNGPGFGSLSGTPPAMTYTPSANFNGTDSFTFTAFDGTATSAAAVVTIAVSPEFDPPPPPSAQDDAVTVFEDFPEKVLVLANDLDPAGTSAVAVLVDPLFGVATVQADRSIEYSPVQDYFGPDSFTYQLGGVSSAVVSIEVVPINDGAPSLVAISSPAIGSIVPVLSPTLTVVAATDSEDDALVHEFEIDTSLAFDSPDFEASGAVVETGALIAWSPNQLREDTLYYWRAHAGDGAFNSDWVGASFFVSAADDAPEPPVPLSPGSGALLVEAQPSLLVANGRDPEGQPIRYWFEVHADAPDGPMVDGAQAVEETADRTSWTLTDPLDAGRDYYWIAWAADAAGNESVRSAPEMFQIYEAPSSSGGCGCTLNHPDRPLNPQVVLAAFAVVVFARCRRKRERAS